MSSTRSRPTSISGSSLMQDVPGSLPNLSVQQEPDDYYVVEEQQHLSLSQAVYARRAEYVRPRQIRVKLGTWNVAAHKGTEKDVKGWFVDGRGVEHALAGLAVTDDEQSTHKESLGAQEARFSRKQSSLPKSDSAALPGNEDVDLYVLGLQEVVDITSTTEALRPYTDPAVSKKWREEMSAALPRGYRLVAEQQLIGLLLLVYASPDIADDVKSVSTTSVGTGLMGYMGNKGAVTARLIIGDTTRLVFVNSHLAAGADKAALDRRNWDAAQILQRTRFEPIKDGLDLSHSTGEQIGDGEFAFWMGDLNYRLQTIPGEDVRRLLMLHTRNEYDVQRQSTQKLDKEIDIATRAAKRKRDHPATRTSLDSSRTASPRPSMDGTSLDARGSLESIDDLDPNGDPASLQTTISSLLPHDELHQQMKLRKAFHDGWREGPITFLPTYKYDVGSVGIFDSSEKRRAPSWCDRILYRSRRDKIAYDTAVKEEEEAKKRDEEMKANGTDQAADDEEILYDYDPDADGTNFNDDFDEYDEHDAGNEAVARTLTNRNSEDDLRLEYYTAHQRVLSSDHKPLNAVFLLKYDAVVPELKAKVHAEVAKELDKAENEGRPNVTVVVDQQNNKPLGQNDDSQSGFDGVDFGDVKWNQTKIRSLTVANTSRVPASLNFIERPVESGHSAGIAPSWLTLKVNDIAVPSSAATSEIVSLDPGETASVELEIHIHDPELVRHCNESKSRTLEDTLVLRVDNGRDHFIPVRASWLPTSLGRAIDKLIRIPEGGIRRLQSQRPDDGKAHTSDDAESSTTKDHANGPVRFSAPRELFRLTEAIEEVGIRVVAEWEMIVADDSETAPWVRHPGWPFDAECWDLRETAEWQDALSEACNALDTDQSLLAPEILSPETPRIQHLYILSSLLLTFLQSIPEGIITETLWDQIETYLTQLEKSKSKPSEDEIRTAIQEILSQQPSHNISFILITTLLERLVQETAASVRSQTPHHAVETSSPVSGKAGAALRRVTGTFSKALAAPQQQQQQQQRELACSALARIFAGVLFRTPLSGPSLGSKKPSAALLERRRVELVERFLRRDTSG